MLRVPLPPASDAHASPGAHTRRARRCRRRAAEADQRGPVPLRPTAETSQGRAGEAVADEGSKAAGAGTKGAIQGRGPTAIWQRGKAQPPRSSAWLSPPRFSRCGEVSVAFRHIARRLPTRTRPSDCFRTRSSPSDPANHSAGCAPNAPFETSLLNRRPGWTRDVLTLLGV
jgi:hypothetical protein